MLRVLLCRHGETHDNVAGLVQGHGGGALTAAGRAQAAALGRRLAATRLDAVFCSDLARATETLRLVADAAASPHPPPTLTPQLRERGGGVLEGAALAAVDEAVRAAGVPPRRFRPDGGESWEDVAHRATAFLDMCVAHSSATRRRPPDAPRPAQARRGAAAARGRPLCARRVARRLHTRCVCLLSTAVWRHLAP